LTPQSRIGGTACENTQWVSDSSVAAMVPNGFNVELAVILTVDRGLSSLRKSFTYDEPSSRAVSPGNLATMAETSSSLLTVIGQNFGAKASSPLVRLHGTKCEFTAWLSATSIVNKVSSGAASYGYGHIPGISVTCSLRITTVSSLFTYNHPQVTQLSRFNAPASGSVQIVMNGMNFGSSDYTPIAYVDYNPCALSMWVSDSIIICKLPQGYGSGKGVAVQVGNEFGSPFHDDFIFQYDDQNILMPYGIPNPYHDSMMIWLKADNINLQNEESVSSWPDDSQHALAVTAINAPKRFDHILNEKPVVRFNASKMQSLILTADSSSPLAVAFGGGSVLSKTFSVFLVLRFTRDGEGHTAKTSLFSASNSHSQDDFFNLGIHSLNGLSEYRLSTVVNANSVQSANRKITTDNKFSILALVHSGFSVYLYKDGTVNPMIQPHNLESAEGSPPYVRPVKNNEIDGMIGLIDSIRVGAIALDSNISQFFNGDMAEVLVYDTDLELSDVDRLGSYLSRKYSLLWQITTGPQVTSISPCNGPAKGGTLVTVFGTHFSPESKRIRAQVRGINCTEIVVLGATAFTMIIPPGVGIVDVDIVSDEVSKTVHGLFQYDNPVITSLKPSTVPSRGGSIVSVFGSNFGSRHDTPEAKVSAQDGDVGCKRTTFVSDSSLECVTPRKFLSNGNMVVSVGRQLSVSNKDSAIAFVDIPSYYACNLGAECTDCCRSRCELEFMHEDKATGKTHAECRQICVEYCGNALRKATSPISLQVGPGTPAGSRIPLQWEAPLDSGGTRILRYAISYTIKGEVETVVETANEATHVVISQLLALTKVSGIRVQAITKFGYGAYSNSLEAFTSNISPPSEPRNFVVAEVDRTSMLLTWEEPEDKGGALAIWMHLTYVIGEKFFQSNLRENTTSHRIEGLKGNMLVHDIMISAQNSAGRGLQSGPLQALTGSSSPPSISSVADTSTLVGESTAPQSFYVHDEETVSTNLRVRTHSSNEHLVTATGIAVGGVSSHRFVIVTPVQGVVGTARITLVVQDSDSLTNETSFLLSVESAWHSLWPTSGLASGGTHITVSGGGFVVSNEQQYNCIFTSQGSEGAAQVVATVETSSKLLCIAPKWTYPAQITQFSLTLANKKVAASALGERARGEFSFSYTEVWSSLSHTSALALGGTRVTISGDGFDTLSTRYTVQLVSGNILMKGTDVVPFDSRTIMFTVPAWGAHHAAQSVNVYLRNDGVTVPRSLPSLQTILLSESWSGVSFLTNQLKTTVNSEGGETITIHGNGFDTSASIQYQCAFTEQCCQRPPCADSECVSMVSPGVYARSSTRIECQLPSWGTLLPYSGAATLSSYTSLTLSSTHQQADVLFTGVNAFEFEFQELFKTVFPRNMPITGGSITIFGSGFDSKCGSSTRGCYRCVFSAPGATTMYGAAKPCADSSCKGALSVPTSTKEVTCAFPNWGTANSAGNIMVTLLHESGHLLNHVSETTSGGNIADKFILTEESWVSFRPRAAYLTNTTEVTVTGAGFDPQSQYSCAIRSIPEYSRDCVTALDCIDVPGDEMCASDVSCISAKCSQEVSYSIKSTQNSLFQIVCRINATRWGSCFPAATTQVVVRRTQGSVQLPVEVPVFFNGAANDDKLVYAESWTSITPPSGDKFGFDDVVIRGKGFNVKDPYSLRFTYQQVSLTADPVFPSSPSRIDFKTPNWASRSGM
jgi:hypothetical protein